MNKPEPIRSGFTFYRSFCESVSDFSEEEQMIMYKSIIEYALLNKEPEINNVYLNSVFKAMKPNIDSSIRKYDQRAENNRRRSAAAYERKETISEQEPNTSRTDSEQEPDLAYKNKNKNKNKNNKENNKENKKELYKDLSPELINALDDYEKMREEISKPITDRARETILKRLVDYSGGDVGIMIEILNQSIVNCWRDVYPLKTGNNNQSSNKGLSPTDILIRYAGKE